MERSLGSGGSLDVVGEKGVGTADLEAPEERCTGSWDSNSILTTAVKYETTSLGFGWP